MKSKSLRGKRAKKARRFPTSRWVRSMTRNGRRTSKTRKEKPRGRNKQT